MLCTVGFDRSAALPARCTLPARGEFVAVCVLPGMVRTVGRGCSVFFGKSPPKMADPKSSIRSAKDFSSAGGAETRVR